MPVPVQLTIMEMKKMAYNIPDNYIDQTPAAPLDQKTLNKMVWRSLFPAGIFQLRENAGLRLAVRDPSGS